MKLSPLGLLLNLVLYQTAAQRQRYVIVHPTQHDPFGSISDIETTVAETIMHTANQDFTLANLTENQALAIKHELQNVNGIIVVDEQFQLPEEQTEIAARRRNLRNTYFADDNPFLNDIPKCKAHVDGVEIIIMDTKMYKIPELSNVAITYGPNYMNIDEPCNTHATRVASVVAGKTVGIIPSGDRSIYNIIIFGCDGKGYISDMISGFNSAIERGTTNKKNNRATIINLSATANANMAVDAAANAAVEAGIPTFVAAGNNGRYACGSQSPAEAEKVITVGGTEFPGDMVASNSNYGDPCVKFYLPYCVTVIDVFSGKPITSCGTSFDSPIGAALGAIEKSINPKATPAQIEKNILARTVTVTPTAYSSITTPIQVMYSNQTCIDPFLFRTFTANSPGNFSTWYPAVKSDTLCISFKAKSRKSGGQIGLRADNSSSVVKLNIPKKILDQNIPVNFVIEQDANKAITLLYYKKNKAHTLSSMTASENMKEVAFGNSKSSVTYSNALSC